MTPYIDDLLVRARAAARPMARSAESERNRALASVADAIESDVDAIVAANARDLESARAENMAASLLDRLALDAFRVGAVARAVREIAALPDALGETRDLGARPNGLRISRRRIPLGVIAVVYEARPNVTVEAASLAIKSGNVVVLRGGREARTTNAALADCVSRGLERAGLPRDAAQLVRELGREHVEALLGAAGRVDLAIPRGGDSLMRMVDEHARVPVVRHGQGITHAYVDATAKRAMAEEIVYNAKVQRPGVCNALETLLIHRDRVEDGTLAAAAARLVRGGVQLRADDRARAVLERDGIVCVPASAADWDTEFLGLVLAVRVVDGLDDALDHIAAHGSHHTATIVTEDPNNAERFLREVDASCVLWNASTRFNDGGELGLGAEMGISTSKMHAYGPMGLRELTAEKFVVHGAGQTRE